MGALFHLMFANCVYANIGSLFTIELEIVFSPVCSKFTAECDCNTKNSQNVQNLGFFGKIDGFFEKELDFFKIARFGIFAVECVSNCILSLKCLLRPIYELFGKIQKILNNGKIRKYDKERVFFSRKKRFHFLKSLLYKMGNGVEYAGGCRPSC